MGVTIEAEASMTSVVSADARSIRPIAHAPLMYARYVFCMSDVLHLTHYSGSTYKSVGRALGCMFTVHSLAASFF